MRSQLENGQQQVAALETKMEELEVSRLGVNNFIFSIQ